MTDSPSFSLSAQDCLVALMVAVSASDEDIRTAELIKIQSAVNILPIFANYDTDRLSVIGKTVFDLFEQEDGLDALFGLIREALTPYWLIDENSVLDFPTTLKNWMSQCS